MGLADVPVWSLLVVVLVPVVLVVAAAVVVDIESDNRRPKRSLSEFESHIITRKAATCQQLHHLK